MTLSRRDFLGNAAKLAATQVMPSSVLGVPLQSLIGMPAQALISIASVKDAIESLSGSWSGYRIEFSEVAEMIEDLKWNISLHKRYRETREYPVDIRPDLETRVGEKFDQLLPQIFDAVSKLRAVKQGVLTDDPQHNEKVFGGLRIISSLQRDYYVDESSHLVELCPAEYSSLPDIENPYDYSDRKNYEQWTKDHHDYWNKQDHADRSKSIKGNLDDYKSSSLVWIKSTYESFLSSSVNLGLVDADYTEMAEHRRAIAFSKVKPILEVIKLPEDVALCLADSVDNVQIFEWFDETKLLGLS